MTLADQGIQIGAHFPIQAGGDLLESINMWEQRTSRRMDIVNQFRKWGAPSGDWNLESTRISVAQSMGQDRIPMITWMPVDNKMSMADFSLASIAAGLHDSYLKTWAEGLRGMGKPVYLRLMHEMNGNWYPWSGSPEEFVAAWRHIKWLFFTAKATNVKFVWCVNTSDQGNYPMEDYWPGEAWVDVLGVDGYNNYGGWRSFDRIIRPAYDRLCRLSAELPVIVCETASAEGNEARWPGTDYTSKATWLSEMFDSTGFERITAVCYFDQHNPDSFDWRINTSGRAETAWRNAVRRLTGYVPAPGPYVPPIPDRVTAMYANPGMVSVTWRQVPAFCRGYVVRAVHKDGFTRQATFYKPRGGGPLVGLPVGDYNITVSSFTNVRTSRPSAAAPVTVKEAF